MHNTCTIFCLPKAKVFLPPWLTLLRPQQKFAPEHIPQRGGKPSAATGLSTVERKQWKCTHQGAQEVPLTDTAGVLSVCVCLWAYILYMSASKQYCRLCNNSVQFKAYNEQFRGATYITVFNGISQSTENFEENTCQHCNITVGSVKSAKLCNFSHK